MKSDGPAALPPLPFDCWFWVFVSPCCWVDVDGNGCVYAGRSARHSENAGDGNTVNALASMLVTVSG